MHIFEYLYLQNLHQRINHFIKMWGNFSKIIAACKVSKNTAL